MTNYYHHTQIGYLIIIVFAITCLVMALLLAKFGFIWIGFSVMVLIMILLVLFATLTVTVSVDVLEIHFGPGVIRKKFYLREIESCQIVKNPWYYGWGIRLTPHGWLYNVSGFSAVEIKMKDGKKYRIGTDAPNELEQVIRQRT